MQSYLDDVAVGINCGSITVRTEFGLLLRIDAGDADAIGLSVSEPDDIAPTRELAVDADFEMDSVTDALRTVYDPEIPVSIVDLGLVYRCEEIVEDDTTRRIEIDMTMTAPGCGMGDILCGDARRAVASVPGVERLVERWPAMSAFVTVGALSIVAGGLVAALTRPIGFDDGPWVAAYLVLVGGVAQLALGVGQACLAPDLPSGSTTNLEAASWNIGLVATIAGTLLDAPWLTTLGGLATAAALILFLASVRRTFETVRRLTYMYRAIGMFVLSSIPVGLALAWLRHG